MEEWIMKGKILILLGLIMVLSLSGCVTAKVVERERVDQEISGNQGYLKGNVPSASVESRSTTRQYIKVDVELPPYKTQKETGDKEIWGNEGYLSGGPQPRALKPTAIFPSRPSPSVSKEEQYTPAKSTVIKTKPTLTNYVVKKNDSLWKIAQRPDVYGDGNKWTKIYQANKDKIKNPNKLRPGIILVIPQD